MSTELCKRAITFAEAQETMAANAAEDRAHWHHVALAELLRELSARLTLLHGALTRIHDREWAAGDAKAGARNAAEMWTIADQTLQVQ